MGHSIGVDMKDIAFVCILIAVLVCMYKADEERNAKYALIVAKNNELQRKLDASKNVDYSKECAAWWFTGKPEMALDTRRRICGR